MALGRSNKEIGQIICALSLSHEVGVGNVWSRHKRGAYRSCSLGRGFYVEIGTIRTMLVPSPAAVWISNFPSICEALVRMLPNPKPSLFFSLALEIPDPLSFT